MSTDVARSHTDVAVMEYKALWNMSVAPWELDT